MLKFINHKYPRLGREYIAVPIMNQNLNQIDSAFSFPFELFKYQKRHNWSK